jgi:hypothetical protein
MSKRALVLLLVIALLTPAAFACDECIDTQCIVVTPTGGGIVDGTACGGEAQPWSTRTYQSCHSVRNCSGCMGISCDTQQTANATPAPLRLVEVKIVPAQSHDNDNTPRP